MDKDVFHEHIEPWLRLQAAPGIGALTAAKLLRHFGTAQNLLQASPNAISELVGSQKAKALIQRSSQLDNAVAQCLHWQQSDSPLQQRAILTWQDARYPPDLLEIADPPIVLFAQGPEQWLSTNEPPWHTRLLGSIAIVGSRSPTQQGRENAFQMAKQLQQLGIGIVSGMALGIDAAAHEGALETQNDFGPPTIAVLGTGIDCIYPRQNTELYHTISARGLVLSECPIGTPPLAHNFPKRTRIITGITQGTLVVEAALQSGSLISARLAAEQGKEVFAIPGSIHSHQSKGCHLLIKQGAKLVEGLQDMLDELPRIQTRTRNAALPQPMKPVPNDTLPHTSKQENMPTRQTDQNTILKALGFDPSSLDAIMARTGMSAAIVQMHLLELELAGCVERLSGGLFQRLQRG